MDGDLYIKMQVTTVALRCRTSSRVNVQVAQKFNFQWPVAMHV